MTQIEDATQTNVNRRKNLPFVKVAKPFQGFVDFIREQGVVGIGIGFVFGVAAKSVVDSIVNNIVNPIVGILYGGGQLMDKYWCLKASASQCTNKLNYGAVVNQLINFLLIALVVYFIVKSLKLDKLDKKKS